MNRFRFLLILLWGCCSPSLWGESFLNVQHLSRNDNAIQGRIIDVIQDHEGYIWFSSFNGLNQYDGACIRKYKSCPGTHSAEMSNRIDLIRENSNGDIWCQSNHLYLFQRLQEDFLDVQPALEKQARKKVNAVYFYPLANGFTWVVTDEGECFRLNDNNPLGTCEQLKVETSRSVDIQEIYLDKQGNEWVLTKKGVFLHGKPQVMHPGSFRHAFQVENRLWLTAPGGYISYYSYPDGQMYNVKLPQHLKRIYHQVLYRDSLLISATDKGILTTNAHTGECRFVNEVEATDFSIDSRGRIWAFTPTHTLCCMELNGQCKTIPLSRAPEFGEARARYSFVEDKQQTLWLLLHNADGIYHYNEQQGLFQWASDLRTYYHSSQQLFTDCQGNVWNRDDGNLDLISFHSTGFDFHNRAEESEVRALMFDHQGRLWQGYKDGSVQLTDSLGGEIGYLHPSGRIVPKPCTFSAGTYCMLNDSKGNFWLGTRTSGLYQLQPTEESLRYKVTHYTHHPEDEYSISDSAVFTILEDSKKNIWVGTFKGGLNLWKNGVFYNMNNRLGADGTVVPITVRFLKELPGDIILVGAREGLFSFSNNFSRSENIAFYKNTKKGQPGDISENDVMHICQTRNGDIWVATNSGGINRIASDNLLSDNLVFETIDKAHGLASDVTFTICEDDSCNLWVASENALSRISSKDGGIEIYTGSDFSQPLVLSEGIPLRMGHRFVYGTLSGNLWFDPLKISKNSHTCPLKFTGLSIENEPATQRLHKTNCLKLATNERNITLQFAALDYGKDALLQYAYRLEGVNPQWLYTRENSVTYLSLPSGKHTFHLRSTNVNGVWVPNERTLTIDVTPRFFETGWGIVFIVVMALLLIVLAAWIFHQFYQLRHHLSIERQMTDIKLRFFTDISHELRTPLTLIDGPVSEVLEDQHVQGQSRRYLEVVQKNTRRMLNLINQILDFRKIQNKKMILLLEQVDVREAVQEIMNNFQELAHQHAITFELVCPAEGAGRLWIDRDKFEKIFFNLLSNAFKYTADGKRIRLVIIPTDQSVELSVEDEGIGIKKEEVDHLFLRFETIVNDNLFKPSSGIGLSLVKQLVELHHGYITVDSTVSRGSTFTVVLRRGKEQYGNDENVEFIGSDTIVGNKEKTEEEEERTDTNEETDKPEVLVVEDNTELRTFIRDILSTHYHVLEADNGEDGLEEARQHWPSLIISDIMMPRMDGFQLVKEIRQDMDIYSIPIILLTAKSDIDDRVKGVNLGADDYIVKPFSAMFLKARVNALIEQRQKLKERLLDSLEKNSSPRLNIEPSDPQIIPSDELFIQDVMTYMEKNMSNSDISINDFARALNMGRTRFTRKLKSLLGLTPIDFMQNMRIKRSKQLLASNNFTISEVAYQTGFNDPKYFTRSFKKYYGCTPTEFLHDLKKEEENQPEEGQENTAE